MSRPRTRPSPPRRDCVPGRGGVDEPAAPDSKSGPSPAGRGPFEELAAGDRESPGGGEVVSRLPRGRIAPRGTGDGPGDLYSLLFTRSAETAPSLPAPGAREAWEKILAQARGEGLAFRLLELPGLPEWAAERLRREALFVAGRNLALAGCLREILGRLAAKGIAHAPIRGIALAERLYGKLLARPMGDIDLLVRKQDIGEVGALLTALGYEQMDRRRGFSPEFSYTLKFFRRTPTMVIVEPHWSIVYPPFVDRLDMQAVWDRCVPTRVLGEPTLSLGREDLLVHLALHLDRRHGAPLLWWFELDRLLAHEAGALRPALLVSICREAGVERIVARVLRQASEAFASPVPAGVFASLDRRRHRQRTLANRLAASPVVEEREGLAQLLAVRGPLAKARYVGALLFPSPRFMALQYGLRRRRDLAPAYLARFARFIVEGAKGMAQLLVGSRCRSRSYRSTLFAQREPLSGSAQEIVAGRGAPAASKARNVAVQSPPSRSSNSR